MAKIGIDTTAVPANPVGAGRYIVDLVRAFSNLELQDELVIIAHPSGRELIGCPERAGFHWLVVPEKAPSLRLAWEQTWLPYLAKQQGLDLLHSLHYTRPLYLPCRSVVTIHDMTFFLFPHLHTRSKRLFFPFMMRLSTRLADRLICVSESTRQDTMRLLKVDPSKLVTVPLGVDARFKPVADPQALASVRAKYNLPDHFILYVGLVEPRKNLPLLVRAFKPLSEQFKELRLVVVGRMGWAYEEVFSQIEALGLKEKVQFTGYMPGDELPMVYNLADVFVYPTRYEGFGLPVLEAMACGAPVVSTAVSSIPEIVGQAGLLVPPDDLQALTGRIADILSSPALREQLARQGPQQASQFSWARTARETAAVYSDVLGKNG